MTINKHSIFLIFLLIPVFVAGQNNLLKIGLGGSRHLNNDASGYTTSAEFQRNLRPKHAIGVEISYVYANSRGIIPENISASNLILRDYTHIPELPNLDWNRNSFAKMSLKSKPDRYFNANLGIKYINTLPISEKKLLKMGVGFVLTFNDEMVVDELVEGLQFKSPAQNDVINVLIPVFRFDTYIDLGILPQIEYNYKLKEKINIGLTNKYYIFPKSKKIFTTLDCSINIQF